MSNNELMNTTGFGSFDLTVDPGSTGRVTPLCFGPQGNGPWTFRLTQEPAPPDFTALCVGKTRGARRFFGPGMSPELHVVEPGKNLLAAVAALNAKVPREEWELDRFSNQPRPPYEGYHALFFVTLPGFEAFSWEVPTRTKGATGAITALSKKISWARRHYGQAVLPLILFTDEGGPSAYGPRRYPVLQVKKWCAPDGSDAHVSTSPPDVDPAPRDGFTTEQPEKVDLKDHIPY